MMKNLKMLFVLVAVLMLAACGGYDIVDQDSGEKVAEINPCEIAENVSGMSIIACEPTATEMPVEPTATEMPVEPTVTEMPVEPTATSVPVDMSDTYRGFRLDFPERAAGRVIIEETLVDGPAIHQDRDGNVTVIRKDASATFTSGIIWLYKVGDANSFEDETIFLENQVIFFNDPAPLWIEPID